MKKNQQHINRFPSTLIKLKKMCKLLHTKSVVLLVFLKISYIPVVTANQYITYARGNDSFDRTLYMINLETGVTENISNKLNSIIGENRKDNAINISPDGSHLIINSKLNGNKLYIINIDNNTKDVLKIENRYIWPEHAFAISNDGNIVAITKRNKGSGTDVVSYIKSNGKWKKGVILSKGTDEDFFAGGPAFSFDSKRIIFTCRVKQNILALCSNNISGNDLKIEVSERNLDTQKLHLIRSPDYTLNGDVVFEVEDVLGEVIWIKKTDKEKAYPINTTFRNDNSPCVLPNNYIASLWLSRPGNPKGKHELKLMPQNGSHYKMLVKDINIRDIGLGCGGSLLNQGTN